MPWSWLHPLSPDPWPLTLRDSPVMTPPCCFRSCVPRPESSCAVVVCLSLSAFMRSCLMTFPWLLTTQSKVCAWCCRLHQIVKWLPLWVETHRLTGSKKNSHILWQSKKTIRCNMYLITRAKDVRLLKMLKKHRCQNICVGSWRDHCQGSALSSPILYTNQWEHGKGSYVPRPHAHQFKSPMSPRPYIPQLLTTCWKPPDTRYQF